MTAPPPAGVTVTPRSLTGEGGAATYTMVLNSQPTGNVIIDVDARPQTTLWETVGC